MNIDVLTLFPDMIRPMLAHSMLARAIEGGYASVSVTDIREYSKDKHRKTDDTPFGGGAGMVLSPQPAFDALRAVGAEQKKKIYMSPRGRMLDRELLTELIEAQDIVILCGHYEGVDQRIIDAWDMEEVSIGDYILTGGELASLVLIDALVRLIPGVLGNEDSHEEESVYSGLLEYDQYTKPRVFEEFAVPDVLFGGNHRLIREWQWEQSLRITLERRPDLFEALLARDPVLSKSEKAILKRVTEQAHRLEDDA